MRVSLGKLGFLGEELQVNNDLLSNFQSQGKDSVLEVIKRRLQEYRAWTISGGTDVFQPALAQKWFNQIKLDNSIFKTHLANLQARVLILALAPVNAQKVTDDAMKFASSTIWRFWFHDCLDLAQKRGQMFDALMLQPLLLAAQVWYEAAQAKLDKVYAEFSETIRKNSFKPTPAIDKLLIGNIEIVNKIRYRKKLIFENLDQVIKLNDTINNALLTEKNALENLLLEIKKFKTKFPKQTSESFDFKKFNIEDNSFVVVVSSPKLDFADSFTTYLIMPFILMLPIVFPFVQFNILPQGHFNDYIPIYSYICAFFVTYLFKNKRKTYKGDVFYKAGYIKNGKLKNWADYDSMDLGDAYDINNSDIVHDIKQEDIENLVIAYRKYSDLSEKKAMIA